MIFSAIIVDDEEYARENIKAIISQDNSIQLVGECKNGQEAIEAIKKYLPDIVFLDIQMPEVNGFEVIEAVKDIEAVHYIFTTAYDEFALKAFEVNAIDYLLKPFDDTRFNRALEKAKGIRSINNSTHLTEKLVQFLNSEQKTLARYLKKIPVKTGGRTVFIDVDEIDWIEADNQYVKIHAWQNTHTHRESLRNLEELLDPTAFFRVHRSAIVNLNRVKSMEPYFKGDYVIHLKNGSKVKLAKTRKEGLKKAMRWYS